MATTQLNLFERPVSALLTWRTLAGTEPATWEWMECVRGYMPRDDEGYALVDSRDINPPKLHNTHWGKRWSSL